MASEPASILLKIGDKTVAEHLEALDPKDVFNPGHAFFYSPKAIIRFRDVLMKQPFYVESLSNHKTFIAWLRKAANFLSGLFLNTSLFNLDVQKQMQPLIDLLYYFKEADPIIKNVLFRFELVKLLESTENSEKNRIKEATYLHNVLIGQPIYVLAILYNNTKIYRMASRSSYFFICLFFEPIHIYS